MQKAKCVVRYKLKNKNAVPSVFARCLLGAITGLMLNLLVMHVRAEAYVAHPDTPSDPPAFNKYGSAEEQALAQMLIQNHRRHRRRVFTFGDWRRHRSQSRYFHHIQTIRESGVVRAIARPVAIVATLSSALACYNHLFSMQPPWLPPWLPPPPTLALEPIQMTTIALSLLLVFRTNASYARWEEGRRSFGSITTTCRDIARQALSWLPSTQEGRVGKAMACRWLTALSKASMVHLREEHDLRQELAGVLLPKELDSLEASTNRPMYCLMVLSNLFASSKLPHQLVMCLDHNLSTLVIAINACERILNTPIPLSYTRHTARFLMAWLVCIPFTLWPYVGWAMVPLAALVSFVLLGIEEIGIFLEEPFSVLALEHLSTSCEECIGTMPECNERIIQELNLQGIHQ